MRFEKANAPPPNPFGAFSLTKSGECVKSDKPVAILKELYIGRALTRLHFPKGTIWVLLHFLAWNEPEPLRSQGAIRHNRSLCSLFPFAYLVASGTRLNGILF